MRDIGEIHGRRDGYLSPTKAAMSASVKSAYLVRVRFRVRVRVRVRVRSAYVKSGCSCRTRRAAASNCGGLGIRVRG